MNINVGVKLCQKECNHLIDNYDMSSDAFYTILSNKQESKEY